MKRLYDLFIKVDATQIEVNPFGETDNGNGESSVLFVASWPWAKNKDVNSVC